jgi:hypothetical protein
LNFLRILTLGKPLKIFYESRQKITANTMSAVWKYLLPNCPNGVCGYENRVDFIEETSVIGKVLDFENVDSPNVRMDSHSQPVPDTDLIELQQQRTCDEKQ